MNDSICRFCDKCAVIDCRVFCTAFHKKLTNPIVNCTQFSKVSYPNYIQTNDDAIILMDDAINMVISALGKIKTDEPDNLSTK